VKKLTLQTGAVALVLGLTTLATACSSSDSPTPNGSTSSGPAVTSPPATSRASLPGKTAPPAPGRSSTPAAGQSSRPAKTTSQPNVAGGCEAVAGTGAETGCAIYLNHAVPARARYYNEARNPNHAQSDPANAGLAKWYSGIARQDIADQVSNWDPNYTVDIDTRYHIQVTSGEGAASAGVALLHTTESWSVVTEGGPVLTRDGRPSMPLSDHHFTITLLRQNGAWTVNKVVQN
jgi:hypothetical protein